MHLSWLDPHKMRKLTVVGRDKMAVFDDMEPERKVTVYDKGPVLRAGDRVAGTRGRHQHPAARARRAAAPRVRALPVARLGRGRPARAEPPGRSPSSRRSSAPGIARDSRGLVAPSYQAAETAVIYPGTVIGEGCVIGDHAVVGKQPRFRHARRPAASSCLRSSSAPGRSSRRARSSSPARRSERA